MKKGILTRLASFLGLIACLISLSNPSEASTTGTVQGTVKSAAGSPLKGVDITLVGTGQVAVTDKKGSYIFTGVQPGSYTVRAGLVTYKQADAPIVVQQDNTSTADFTLEKDVIKKGSEIVGSPVRGSDTMTQYTVTARTEQLEKSNPNDLYQFTGLVRDLPGVTIDGAGFVHLRGADENQTGFMMDGVSLLDPTSNQFSTNTVSVGMRSFNMVTGGADASYGDVLGGFINEVVANGKDFRVGDKLSGGHVEYTSGPGHGWNYTGTHNEYGGILPGGKLDYYFSTIMFKNIFPGNTSLSALDSSFDGLGKFNYYANPNNTVTLFIGQGFEEYNEFQPFDPTLTPFQTTHFNKGAVSSIDTGVFQQDHQAQHYYLNYLSFKHSFTPKSFLFYRAYTLTMPTEFHAENTTGVYERTAPNQVGNELDYTGQLTPTYQLRAGLRYLQQRTDFNTVASWNFTGPMPPLQLDPNNPFSNFYYDTAEKVKPTQTMFYLTNQVQSADKKLTLDLGARFAQQHYKLDAGLPNYTDHYVDPRVGASYSPTRDFVIRSSYSVLSQFPETSFIEHLPPGLVGDTITALPGIDPSSNLTWAQDQAAIMEQINAPFNHLNTEHDNDFDLGAEKAFTALGGQYDLSVTGFQRKLYDEVEQNVFANNISYSSLGHGHASGTEVLLTKRSTKPTDWNGFVSYTNMSVKATAGFSDTFYVPYFFQAFHGDPTISLAQLAAGDDSEFPTSFDQRHTIAVVANKRINKWFEMTGVMDAGSGYPFQNSLGTLTAAADAQHAVFSTGPTNFFAEVPITMQNQTTLQPFNATPGMSGWHYKFSLNSSIYLTQDTNLFFDVDNIFNDRAVLVYGTNPFSGPSFYSPPSPQYPQGRVYYGPRATQNPIFVSFGVRTRF